MLVPERVIPMYTSPVYVNINIYIDMHIIFVLYLQHGLNLTTHHNPLFCWHARLNFNVGSGEFIGLMSPT